jgi:hypothetical protein
MLLCRQKQEDRLGVWKIRNAYKNVVAESQGKMPLEYPQRRQEESTKMDVRKMRGEGVDRTQ